MHVCLLPRRKRPLSATVAMSQKGQERALTLTTSDSKGRASGKIRQPVPTYYLVVTGSRPGRRPLSIDVPEERFNIDAARQPLAFVTCKGK
jgi:hypothetical protein